jgi:CheY-like chemotaxis protein
MLNSGPIVIVEDDADDQSFISDALKALAYKNDVVFLPDGLAAIEYLEKCENKPFLIISDINMPGLNGWQLKNHIENSAILKSKCNPYVFFTTTVTDDILKRAETMNIQGLFQKPWSIPELQIILKSIIDYWQSNYAPIKRLLL